MSGQFVQKGQHLWHAGGHVRASFAALDDAEQREFIVPSTHVGGPRSAARRKHRHSSLATHKAQPFIRIRMPMEFPQSPGMYRNEAS